MWTWFEHSHATPPMLKALRMLHQLNGVACSTQALADAAGCSAPAIVHHFRTMYGISASEYAARLRVREGMSLLRTSEMPVDEAARRAGYESANKFYRRVRQYTSLRPSQIRSLPDVEYARILETRLSVRRRAGENRAIADG